MSDIVERLQAVMAPMQREIAIEAAAEIKRLKAALRGIANEAIGVGSSADPLIVIARAALEGKPVVMCEDCGERPADLPSRLCPGCEAYREHQR